MIAYLQGRIKYKSAFLKKNNFLVLDAGGVGYKVFVLTKLASQAAAGQELEVFVYTQVAETALDLYGFQTREELDFFEALLSVSGIGPRSALDIMEKAKIEDIKKAAQSGQPEILNQVSGIGPKTAQKIVDGLKDKFGAESPMAGVWGDAFGEALEALIGLGYSAGEARDALGKCQSAEAGEKVKEALKMLGRK